MRQELDSGGHSEQQVLALADGTYDTEGFWRSLAPRTVALLRTPLKRRLSELPPPYGGHGRRPKYGAVAPSPAQWLPQRQGLQHCLVAVRGRHIKHRYQVHGPYVCERAAAHPLFLLVVGGASWKAGKRQPKQV